MLRVALALALSGVVTAPAFAQEVLKCIHFDGRIEYRNSPCPDGTRRHAVAVSNLSIIDTAPVRSSDRRTSDVRVPRATAQPAPAPTPAPERSPAGNGTVESALERPRY